MEVLHKNLRAYLDSCESQGYPYGFILTAGSGVFSDNAPPEPEILHTIQAYNARYGEEVRLQMVSLQELYAAIAPQLADAPVYRGDLTDWWANGVGSTPYAVKHYLDARRRFQLCRRLDGRAEEKYPELCIRLELGKTISTDIESVFLPLNIDLPDSGLYLRKGGREAFRPGVDQLPGTCMEYYMSDDGLAYVSPTGSALVAARDTPLYYMGELCHHPIRLCDGKPENNARPVYSWLMNNTWETNFKLDLSGFCEYNYTLWLSPAAGPEAAMDELRENCFDPRVLVVE